MSRGLAILLCGLLALLFHAPATKGEFLFYDDARFVVRNPHIESLDDPGRFFLDLSTATSDERPTKDVYRPVRTLTYALITKVFGKDPSAFHATSVALHAVTTALLAAVLLRAGLGAWAAIAGALFFGLHPVTVETTAWVCSLGDVWCGLFSLLAILLHAKDRWIYAQLALVAALFSKEHAVVVPGIWLGWDLFLRPGRLRTGIVKGALPGLLVAVGFLVFRARLGAVMSQAQEPWGAWTMLSGYGHYWATLLLPSGPTFDARVAVRTGPALPVLIGAVLFAVTALGLFLGPRRLRFGAAWFLMGLVPVSNLVVTLKIPTADRFLYLPLMGVALGVGEIAARWPALSRRASPVVLLLLGSLTVTRIGDWRDDHSLTRAGQRVNPKSLTLLWAEAAQEAQLTLNAIERRDEAAMGVHWAAARRLYTLIAQNAPGSMPVRVWMEMGDLNFGVATWMERLDRRPEMIAGYSAAAEAFHRAHQLQKRGRGNVVDEEVRRAAEAGAKACLKLALPFENPHLDRTCKIALEFLAFLEERYGADVVLPRYRILLVYSAVLRPFDPAKSRVGLLEARRVFRELEKRRKLKLTYEIAMCTMELAWPKRDVPALQEAADLFFKASREHRDSRIRALYYEGRCLCAVAKLTRNKKLAAGARARLKAIAEIANREHLFVPEELRRRINREYTGCK